MTLLFRLFSFFPLSLLHALGAGLGRVAYWLSPTYRRHLDRNLMAAMGGAVSEAVRRQAISEPGKTLMELPKIWCRPHEEVAARVVEVLGWEVIEAARREARGILFLTPHLGCFDISSQYVATRLPVTVLYRPPKQKWLRPLIEHGRARGDRLRLAPADLSGVRRLIAALRRGEAVGLLPDQAPGAGEGRWLPFFGQPAYTMTLAARLSETGAPVVLVFAERLPAGRGFRLHFRAPKTAPSGTTIERAIAINREIEALILECPQQYLWGYNRYKRPAGADAPPAEASS